MAERFAAGGGAAVVRMALEEARNRGDRRLGTDRLLLGLIRDPQSDVARALGVDLESARAALDALDRAALASIGLDVGGLRLANLPPARKRPPLTSAARSVRLRAIREAARTKARRPTPRHMAAGPPGLRATGPRGALMARLGIDRALVRERLAQQPDRLIPTRLRSDGGTPENRLTRSRWTTSRAVLASKRVSRLSVQPK